MDLDTECDPPAFVSIYTYVLYAPPPSPQNHFVKLLLTKSVSTSNLQKYRNAPEKRKKKKKAFNRERSLKGGKRKARKTIATKMKRKTRI